MVAQTVAYVEGPKIFYNAGIISSKMDTYKT